MTEPTELRSKQPRKRWRLKIFLLLIFLSSAAVTAYYVWTAMLKQSPAWQKTEKSEPILPVIPTPQPEKEATTEPEIVEKNSYEPSANDQTGRLMNQVMLIEILLQNQRWALAINLLSVLENEALSLPQAQQEKVLAAIETDKTEIQQLQTLKQQRLGQLQQLQEYVNQQMLLYFSPAEKTEATAQVPAEMSFIEKIKEKVANAVQVQHSDAIVPSALPGFYSGVMLQQGLSQAQLAWSQGNEQEYQQAINHILPWLTPSSLFWLANKEEVIQNIKELTQTSVDFSIVQLNNTEQALTAVSQELAS